MPTVTVIIPVYKVERYLDACVESVVRQSYADLEILLVDDGSPDRCPALCDAWAEKDPRIKVIHRENGGLAAARNGPGGRNMDRPRPVVGDGRGDGRQRRHARIVADLRRFVGRAAGKHGCGKQDGGNRRGADDRPHWLISRDHEIALT